MLTYTLRYFVFLIKGVATLYNNKLKLEGYSMKRIKKVISSVLLSLTIFSNLSIVNVSAVETSNIESQSNTIASELINLDNETWSNYFNGVDINKAKVGDWYIKIDTPKNLEGELEYDKGIISVVSEKDYLQSINAIQPRDIQLTVTSWIKLTYQICPMYGNNSRASIVAQFEWLTTPQVQGDDMFTISTDSNYVLDGQTGIINATILPNKNVSTVCKTSTVQNNISDFVLSGNGTTYKFPLSSTIYTTMIRNLNNYSDYFTFTGKGNLFRTKGCPKVSIGTFINYTGLSNGRITFTYHHKEVSITANPSISISSSGHVSLGGLGASVTYDKAATAINYTWGKNEM